MFLTGILVFAVLSILVLVHELGHFLVAKRMGILVEEFGFGLPPRIFGKKIGETIYSLNALPIGGFVKLYGEDYDEQLAHKGKNYSRTFFAKSKIERTLVLLAGVLMNFLLGVVITSFIFTRGVMVPTDQVHIESVVLNSPAEKAGLGQGDVFLNVDGRDIKSGDDLVSYTGQHLGQELTLKVKKGEKILNVKITPRKSYPMNEGPMGVTISNFSKKTYPLWQAPIWGTWEALRLSGFIAKALGQTLWQLATSGVVPKDVSGPIGIAKVTSEVVKLGPLPVLELVGLISINLAVVNVLPIPALDGGRLLFIGIEAIVGRRVKPKFEKVAHQIGFFLLILLIILITYNDVLRFSILEKIKHVLK